MGIFDKIFKRKEKEPDIIREWAEAMIKAAKENPEERVDLSKWTTDNMHNMRHMFKEGTENWTTDNMQDMTVMFEEAERQKENREDFKNLIVNIPFEYRSFNLLLGNAFTEINLSKNNEFLIINDITSEQEIKLNNMLDGFKNKVGTEWLLSFVDFIKEVNDMKLHQRTIEENFEAKYKVIEKKSLDNIKDPSYSFDDAKNINVSKEDFEAKYKVIEKESFDNIIDETKKVLNDKSNEYNDLKKELENAKVEIERLREKLNGIENNFKTLS